MAASLDAEHLHRAIAFDPANAKYDDLLGRYLFYDLQDVPGALESYKRAVSLEPHSARYWLGLASAYQVMGDSRQQAAVQRAIEVDPRTPTVAWQAGNLFLIGGQPEAALAQYRTVLREQIGEIPIRRPLEMSWRAAQDVHKVEAILPAQPSIWLEFIQMLLEKQEAVAAQTAWTDLMAQKPSFDAKRGLFFVDYWIAHADASAAQRAWEQLAAVDDDLETYTARGNLMVNGGFEHDLLNGGFDWRYAYIPDVSSSLETDDPHGGLRCLALSFTASTSASAGISQIIPVEPGATYHLTAFVKSEEISSANGPRLGIYDSRTHDMLFLSDETLGTTAWHEVSGRFTAGKDTTLATFDIVRTSSSTHINGKFWLDDVALTKE